MLTLIVSLVVLFVLFRIGQAIFFYYVLRDAEVPSENLVVNTGLVLLACVLLTCVLLAKHYAT